MSNYREKWYVFIKCLVIINKVRNKINGNLCLNRFYIFFDLNIMRL